MVDSGAYFFHRRQNPRLALAISICTNAKIDLPLICIFSVSSIERKGAIKRGGSAQGPGIEKAAPELW